jgi:hypothetical protein
LWLNKEKIPKDFFDRTKFAKEISNIRKLKRDIRIRKNTSVKTLVDTIFTKRRISTWEV